MRQNKSFCAGGGELRRDADRIVCAVIVKGVGKEGEHGYSLTRTPTVAQTSFFSWPSPGRLL